MADVVTPMGIRVVATLRVAEQLADKGRTAAEVAGAVGADADALERLMKHLTSAGVFSRDGELFELTELGRGLLDEDLRANFDLDGGLGRGEMAFFGLLHSVRTGEAAFDLQYGRSFWDDVAADPRRHADYDELMAGDVARWARAIVPAYDWGSVGHLIDVGGGNGTLLVELLRANPQLKGTVFDRPATAQAARTTIAKAGLTDRAEAVGGDFFKEIPAGAGAYLLCAIIHDWADEPAIAILRRCAEAAGAGGRVLVVEKTGLDGESVNTAMDLRMLAYFGGKERGVSQIAALGEAAGLRLHKDHPAGDISVIEFLIK
jgi:hypothetical protein